ncbi:hypothetical protein SETIT_9G147000v2, partial [Setaria italica]
ARRHAAAGLAARAPPPPVAAVRRRGRSPGCAGVRGGCFRRRINPTAPRLWRRGGGERVEWWRPGAPVGSESLHLRRERALEEEAEKKFGWILKIFFLGTAGLVGYQFFPYMGDNLLQQSISLLRVKDPLFKRMGASRLGRFAVDDQRRMKVVEMGGAQELLNVLEGAKDDKTRKEALKTLVGLSKSEEAAGFLDRAGAYAIVSSTPNSPEYAEIETYKASLLKAFDQLKS